MSLALFQEETFDSNAAERREIDRVRILDAVAEASARRDHRVGEPKRSNLDGEVGHCGVGRVPRRSDADDADPAAVNAIQDLLHGTPDQRYRSERNDASNVRRAPESRSCSTPPCRSPSSVQLIPAMAS